ncbi:preprotein translocase subunit SecY [Marchantia polymorpha subsp. ruderalis]|uniref:CpSecY n=2 Tax=Marchantia polymorpha TaxID=3197 RepID=A0AAF6AQL7_MARPO|nr:hypothetical protein MARPO_0033s0078 [Marchantia polymorpha]BBM98737.1 hypothetical protein Mp_1g15830 [Marchantia polymorpha subsp. ruderalis]|eukprot:PTQ41669.1 hypothetical protein MARPO_0033s0078 [Marchantia polymorpha]
MASTPSLVMAQASTLGRCSRVSRLASGDALVKFKFSGRVGFSSSLGLKDGRAVGARCALTSPGQRKGIFSGRGLWPSQVEQPNDWEFDPLELGESAVSAFQTQWESLASTVMTSSGGRPGSKAGSSGRGVAAAIEDSSIDFGDFFKGNLPEKFLKVLGLLVLSRIGTYIPLAGVNREAFAGSLDTNSILGTLDSFSGGGIGRLGVSSLGIVPFINAQIVFQLLGTVFPKLQELQKKEGAAGREKVKQYTRYASVGFAIVQAIGQVSLIRPYATEFSVEWAIGSVAALVLGAVGTMYIGEKISDYKLGNGTSLLIFTNIVSYLPASIGRTVAQGLSEQNYAGLGGIVAGFLLLVLGIVYVQEAERKIPINYASRYSARGLRKAAYLPFKVNSTGVMPIIFSTSLLQLPASAAKFTGLVALQNLAVALYPGGSWYVPTNVMLIGFFNYFYTFLQLDPNDLSDQLKRQGASVPAIRPGKATATYIENVLGRISVLGSAFLGLMAAAPALVEGVTHLTAFRGFAGTSVLILVGCATDTARKVQAELVSQKYKTIEIYDIDDSTR